MSSFVNRVANSKGGSSLNLRNSGRRKKVKGLIIPKITREKNTKTRIGLLREFDIPLDPYTGLETPFEYDKEGNVLNPEALNDEHRYKGEGSLEASLLKIKAHHADPSNAEDKARLCEYLDIEPDEWDCSQPDVITEADMELFADDKDLIIFTNNVITIDDEGFTGSEYAQSYLIDIKRDEITGQVVLEEGQEYPMVLRVNSLLSGVAWNKIEKEVAKQEEELGAKLDAEKKKSIIRETMGEIVKVSSDTPVNWILGFQLPQTRTRDIDLEACNIPEMTHKQLAKLLCFIKTNQGIETSIGETFSGAYDDLYNNFLAYEMEIPDIEGVQMYSKIKYNEEKESKRLLSEPWFADFNTKLGMALDEIKDLDKLFMSTMRLRKFTPDLEDGLPNVIVNSISIEDPDLTNELVWRYKDLIILAWEEVGEARVERARVALGIAKEEELVLDNDTKEQIEAGKEFATEQAEKASDDFGDSFENAVNEINVEDLGN